jgi:hypothetical protein
LSPPTAGPLDPHARTPPAPTVDTTMETYCKRSDANRERKGRKGTHHSEAPAVRQHTIASNCFQNRHSAFQLVGLRHNLDNNNKINQTRERRESIADLQVQCVCL